MKHGFIKVAAATPKIRVADTKFNTGAIIAKISEAYKQEARIIVLPELCITGYTCQDLFSQELLIAGALEGLRNIKKATADMEALIFVGLPIEKSGKLYNVAAVLFKGNVLGFVPKSNIPMYNEFYEGRMFTQGNEQAEDILFDGVYVPFGADILFEVREGALKGLCVACEICEDLWVPVSPSLRHGLAGANVIVNLSASSETVGKDEYRNMLVKSTSARLMAGYIYCSAGEGES
ncbi:MAG: NAD(+) synthase, partial [Lachnospiraceae bacterium]|nr:NAD(+) synthase [Lachnospiraceae bacterium]